MSAGTANDRFGWEVISTEWVAADMNWRTLVRKNGELKTVFFPREAKPQAGRLVDLYRV